MKTANIIEGLQLLQRYRNRQDGYDLSASHDEISVTATDRPLSRSDLSWMLKLGWFQQYDEDDHDDGRDFCADDYRPDEPWVAYV